MRTSAPRSGPQPIRFNMTPMIDVVFLLIVFFMLVSQFSSAEHVEIKIPEPDKSRAVEFPVPEKVIINIQYAGPELPPTYLLGSLHVENLAEVSRRLLLHKQQNPELEVVLRADKRVPYEYVRQAMQTIAAARIEVFHIVAKPEGSP
jgi:biopolymer transport protein ExbD